jgi:DNA-binding NarL/FixJ family response regulator
LGKGLIWRELHECVLAVERELLAAMLAKGVAGCTVEFHVGNILRKLNVVSRVEAVVWAKKHGIGP